MLAPLLAQCLTRGLAPLPGRALPTGGPAWPGLDPWPGETEDGAVAWMVSMCKTNSDEDDVHAIQSLALI